MIFKIMNVETYSKVVLTRGFTMLLKESNNYSQNQQKIVSFLSKHKDRVIEIFKHFKDEQNRINMADYVLLLKEIVSIDSKLCFFESRADVEPFFNKTTSWKIITDCGKQYFFDYLGLSQELYKGINQVDIGYDVFWELFDYMIKMTDGFYIEYDLGGEAQNLFKL